MTTNPTEQIAQLQAQLEAAEAERQRIAGRAGTGDRATGRVSGRLLSQLGASTDRALRRYHEQGLVVARLQARIGRIERDAAKAARVPLSAEDVRGARLIRTSTGWHKVVRCSAKSVTVETGYSWNDRIALDKILEVRR